MHDILRAVELALQDQWDQAHRTVQNLDDRNAYWVHAILHKIEGDLDNSRYWYRRAGKRDHVPDEPAAELREIRAEITGANDA